MGFRALCLLVGIGFLPILFAQPQSTDILIADFEGKDYGSWKGTGTAFGNGPAKGTLPGQMVVTGFLGKGLVNSFTGGDKSTGTLTSPPFKVERKFLSFLIGGGGHKDETMVRLLVAGKPVRTALGPNTRPGGSEALAAAFWDVAEFSGQLAQIEIIDKATGGWGHINADHFVLTDRKPPLLLTAVTKEITVAKNLLHFPVKQGAPKRKLTILVDGKEERFFDIELADSQPDWLAPLDVSLWKGKSITVKVDRLLEDSRALDEIIQADALITREPIYTEPLRPRFHFSPRRGWTNDPNGLVYFNGEYHLFFQHNPYGWDWGNMHWGHAVSPDLVHWSEEKEALYPDQLGPMFSGSAVVDWKNTSGFGKNGKPPLVLIYTAAGNPTTQCIAYSNDGRTFTKYEANPVIKQITPGNRDPKVIWHEPTGKWVMTLYVGQPEKKEEKNSGTRHTIHFFTSPNLRDWTLSSVLEGGVNQDHFLFECPDLFELPVDGGEKKKWILLGANSEYVVGNFDGARFTPDAPKIQGFQGRGFYAPQTFSDEPAGRRIQFGWLQAPSPGMPFNQCMTVPLELSLKSTPAGPRLARAPVRELNTLRRSTVKSSGIVVKPGMAHKVEWQGEFPDIELEFQAEPGAIMALNVRGVEVKYDAGKRELSCQGARAILPQTGGPIRLRILADRTAMEIFATGGLVYLPLPVLFKPENRGLSLTASGGEIKLHLLEVADMGSIWEKAR